MTAAASSAPAGGVRFNDRVLAIGSTGSGKSELLNWLFAGLRCQRLLLDTKDEFSMLGVAPARSVDAIDWSQRTIHYKTPPTAGPEHFDQLFRACYHRDGALVVVVHELADVCDFSPNRTPPYFNAYVSKGRGRAKGLYAGSQRPLGIPVRARTENEHVFMVGEQLLGDDHAEVAKWMDRPPRELAQLVDDVQDQLGGEPDEQGRRHAYLWFQRARRQIIACPPLPAEHRAAIARHVDRTLWVDAGGREDAA